MENKNFLEEPLVPIEELITEEESTWSSAEDTETPSLDLFPEQPKTIEQPISPNLPDDETLSSIYSDLKDNDPKKVLEDMYTGPYNNIVMPSLTGKTVEKRDTELSDHAINKMSPDASSALLLDRMGSKYHASTEMISTSDGQSSPITYNTFVDKINNEKFINDPTIEGKNINMKAIDPKVYTKEGKKTDQLKLYYKLMSKSNKGDRIIVPLWHSGFKLIINPPTSTNLLSFHNRLTKELSQVGSDTMGLIYSNYTSLTHKYFLELLEELIDTSTLNISTVEENIFDYISILDLNILYLAVMSTITRNGLEVNITCNNINIIDDEGTPKCDFSANGKLDPLKILWVNTTALPEWMKKQIAVNGTGSVSVEEVKKYQEAIFKLAKEPKYTFKSHTMDLDLDIRFRVPTLATYLSEAEYWRNEISNIVKESLADNYTANEKTELVTYVTSIMRMVSYNSFIEGINIDNEMLVDRELIAKSLTVTNKDDAELINKFIKSILTFIEDCSVAIVAVPSFTCPKCKHDQKSHSNPGFKELIPIAMETLFFDLSARTIVGKTE